MRNISPFI